MVGAGTWPVTASSYSSGRSFAAASCATPRTYPAATKPPRASAERVTELGDPAQLRLIPRQDLGNIPRIQKGLHSRGIQHTWLAADQEKIILNMHQELDRYLRS
jgi:hypothetical protein